MLFCPCRQRELIKLGTFGLQQPKSAKSVRWSPGVVNNEHACCDRHDTAVTAHSNKF